MREVVSSSPAGPSLRVLNNRVKIVAFVITTANGDFGVFPDKDYNPEVPAHNPYHETTVGIKEPTHNS